MERSTALPVEGDGKEQGRKFVQSIKDRVHARAAPTGLGPVPNVGIMRRPTKGHHHFIGESAAQHGVVLTEQLHRFQNVGEGHEGPNDDFVGLSERQPPRGDGQCSRRQGHAQGRARAEPTYLTEKAQQ